MSRAESCFQIKPDRLRSNVSCHANQPGPGRAESRGSMTLPLAPLVDQVLCIGLPDRRDRRRHARTELARVGIEDYRMIDGFAKDSPEVRRAFEAGRVAGFPPCFRCGQDLCGCENKRLMPEQVGAWLAHEAAWGAVEGDRLTVICEDDIKFTERAADGFRFLAGAPEIAARLEARDPVLVRLGRALSDDHGADRPFALTQATTMSNPCYAINRAMAERLLENAGPITTTVDIMAHRLVGRQIPHFTLDPPIAYELSWSTGDLRSDVRPKMVHVQKLREQLQDLDPSSREYGETLEALNRELARFEAERAFQEAGGQDDAVQAAGPQQSR